MVLPLLSGFGNTGAFFVLIIPDPVRDASTSFGICGLHPPLSGVMMTAEKNSEKRKVILSIRN